MASMVRMIYERSLAEPVWLIIEKPQGHSDCGRFNGIGLSERARVVASEFAVINACLQLDVWMPGMSGIELCRGIAASGRHLPTILMSGFDYEHTRQIMREVEPIGSLFKQFVEKQLVRAMRRRCIKNRYARRIFWLRANFPPFPRNYDAKTPPFAAR
jgi:CheY-like chemotaxis protein